LFEEDNTVSNNKSLSPMRPWWALITLVIVYSTGVRVALSLVLCVVFCRSFIVFFSFISKMDRQHNGQKKKIQ
jgi:hypothetical protein